MERSKLLGRLILIVEDEPLIAYDTAQAFEQAGAVVKTAHSLNEALQVVRTVALSAAVIDKALPDGDSNIHCGHLKERSIPFVIYSGYRKALTGECRDAPHINKPADPDVLIGTMELLLMGPSPTPN